MVCFLNLLFFVSFTLFSTPSECVNVTISNVVPRRATNGAILDAHDSKLTLDQGIYHWYAASYGNCTEPSGSNGCADVRIGACGFQLDHNVTLFTSKDLVEWTEVGVVFGASGNLPPNSVLFAPKTVFNAGTGLWTMWFNYIVGSFSNSFYGVATSAAAGGPFVVVNPSVSLKYQDNGDEGLFVDDDGTAYVIYTSISQGHAMSIERLSPNYTTSTGESSGLFGNTFVEAPALFRRNEFYYAVFGGCCCYCGSGSIVTVYTATSPLGPYTKRNVLEMPAPAPALAAPPVANGTITIISASFGVNCGVPPGGLSADAAAACNGLANCSFEACICGTPACNRTTNCIPDPAYGCAKSFSAVWTCSLDPPGAPNRTSSVPPEADGKWGEISCFPPPPPTPLPFGSQQTDIFAYVDSNGDKQYMYIGDHWQSAPDQLKSHDFTVYAPLIFDESGNVTSPGFLANFTVDVGV